MRPNLPRESVPAMGYSEDDPVGPRRPLGFRVLESVPQRSRNDAARVNRSGPLSSWPPLRLANSAAPAISTGDPELVPAAAAMARFHAADLFYRAHARDLQSTTLYYRDLVARKGRGAARRNLYGILKLK
ncbi:hypothetical protein C6P46_002398 [Rhodotorula mucilaginosa]|uniref:Uncharacterized protein n=1 Tax=Rhodotorula mucilaginosa TaxID=5537 RepID=A0A9P6W6I3_RHOMI|nr:hypothetical protein C6P46_002398 [Rhodotorula mucilaginosa]